MDVIAASIRAVLAIVTRKVVCTSTIPVAFCSALFVGLRPYTLPVFAGTWTALVVATVDPARGTADPIQEVLTGKAAIPQSIDFDLTLGTAKVLYRIRAITIDQRWT